MDDACSVCGLPTYLSVIAYAAAAITGCGALVVARKRK